MLCRRLAAQWVFLHILAGLALFAQAGAGAAPPQGQQAITLAYDFESPRLSTAGDHTRLAMRGCGRTRRVGEPALPFRLARVLLPQGGTVTGVEARLTGPARALDVARPVEFGRVAVPFGADAARVAAAKAADRPRPEVYNSNNPYPQQRAELLSVQRMCGYDVALIRLFPVQYTPKASKLLFSPRLELTVHVAPQGSRAAANTTLRRSKADAARVAALVDNPEALPEQPAGPLAPSSGDGPQPAEGPYDYLLVTGSSLLSSFQPLLDRRTAQGLRVKAEAIENIVNNYAGVDTAEKLRNYIIYAYANWGVQYVLLGGDVGVIPARGVYGKVSGAAALGDYVDNSIPCDLYYACLDGPWNFDGDALWGEPNDGAGGGDVDLVPEVYLGRAAVDSVALTQQFVAKTIAYETTPHPHPDTALFLAESLGGGAQGGDGLDTLLPHFTNYTVNWLDDRVAYWDGLNHCIPALNNSPHLVAHCGHTNWNYALRLPTGYLTNLTNSGLFLVNSIGCYPGAFDYSDCFAEVLHLLNGVGAFAVVMNSRYGWYNPFAEWMFSGEFQEAFFENLLTKGHNRIGVAHQLSKTDMLGSVEHVEGPDGMVYRWCYFELTLFGDPYTAITTATSPQNLTVKSFDATPSANNYFTGLNITVNPAPDGVTEFTRSYPRNSTVTLTAPAAYGTVPFRRWTLDGADQPAGQTSLVVSMATNRTAVAVYVGPGIVVQPTAGLKTTEAGGTAQFTVALATQPTANVTIGLSSSDPTEGTVSPASLTFTPANWSQAQTVTITGVDDAETDGNVDYTILTAPAVSADPAYNGLNAPDVSVTNEDNDGVKYAFDFGTAASPVETGYTRITEATAYAPGPGYGWLGGTVGSADRGTPDSLRRDFVHSTTMTFGVDVPAGTYDITLTVGDTSYAHDQMGVYLEGSQVDSLTTAKNQFVTQTYRVAVSDGQLTLRLTDLGGSDGSVVLNALRVATAVVAPGLAPAEPLSLVVLPERGAAPLEVTGLGMGAPAGAEYVWDFGDGSTAKGSMALHTYVSPGTYVVTLKAAGQAAQAIVVVTEAPPAGQ